MIKVPVYTFGSWDPRVFITKESTPESTPEGLTMFQKIKCWLRKLFKKDQPISSPAPNCSYCSFGPGDIKFRIRAQDNTLRTLAEITFISIHETLFPEVDGITQVKGTIRYIIFDKDCLADFKNNQVDIILDAVNEYGAVAQKTLHGVKFTSFYEEITIEDIVFESRADFIAQSATSWAKPEVKCAPAAL